MTLLNPSGKNLKKGLLAMIAPILIIVFALVGFALVNTMVTRTGASLSALNFVFGLLGFLGVIGMIVGPIWGIIRMGKWEEQTVMQIDENSGKGEASVVPEEIKQWNWGAAGLTWIWGVHFHVWLSLLVFIPLVNIVMFIILGLKGNEWAWKEAQWESPQKFMEFQNKWKAWGIFFFIFQILGLLLNVAMLVLQLLFEFQVNDLVQNLQ